MSWEQHCPAQLPQRDGKVLTGLVSRDGIPASGPWNLLGEAAAVGAASGAFRDANGEQGKATRECEDPL